MCPRSGHCSPSRIMTVLTSNCLLSALYCCPKTTPKLSVLKQRTTVDYNSLICLFDYNSPCHNSDLSGPSLCQFPLGSHDSSHLKGLLAGRSKKVSVTSAGWCWLLAGGASVLHPPIRWTCFLPWPGSVPREPRPETAGSLEA